jgi:hypothetical protein
MITRHIHCTEGRAFSFPVIAFIATSVKRHAAPLFVAVLWMAAFPLAAQNQGFSFGNFSFSLSPKVLEDGSITDAYFGYQYIPNIAGSLRLRFSNTAKNEQFDELVPDSIVAIEDETFELFLMPFEYALLDSPSIQLKAGGGLYYAYNTRTEKGFFNMPALEDRGRERVNSFDNDFAMHNIGPNIALGFSVWVEWFALALNGGIVPVFYLNALQNMSITPLMDPHDLDYSQETFGSPYLYADLTVTLFKYVSLALLYDYSKLDYNVIDFDDQLKWMTPERSLVSQSLKVEASARIPMGGNLYTQIGYGHIFDFMRVDSDPLIEGNRQYLIFTAMKTAR